MVDAIIPKPAQRPGFTRRCPACGRRWALRSEGSRDDRILGTVKRYRCRFCGEIVHFGGRLPPGAV